MNKNTFTPFAALTLSAFVILMGILHFVFAEIFVQMVPDFFSKKLELVYISGVFEILGGLGLVIPLRDRLPWLRRFSAYGLALLFIAVFPANLHLAINNVKLNGLAFGNNLETFYWLRLPLQAVFIAWALWIAKEPQRFLP